MGPSAANAWLGPRGRPRRGLTTRKFRGSITQRLISLSTLRSGSHPPPRKTRFRLLARLCRTGLVTRRVPMKGFTFCDDSPFPSFLCKVKHVPISGASSRDWTANRLFPGLSLEQTKPQRRTIRLCVFRLTPETRSGALQVSASVDGLLVSRSSSISSPGKFQCQNEEYKCARDRKYDFLAPLYSKSVSGTLSAPPGPLCSPGRGKDARKSGYENAGGTHRRTGCDGTLLVHWLTRSKKATKRWGS